MLLFFAFYLFWEWNFFKTPVNLQTIFSRHFHHQIGAFRFAADPEHGITLFQEPFRDGMEYFIERFIPNLF